MNVKKTIIKTNNPKFTKMEFGSGRTCYLRPSSVLSVLDKWTYLLIVSRIQIVNKPIKQNGK